ncbi:MAG: alpha/beta hydrolase [Clostridia bacterium]|nr:alpha/beta hydrolase [Clostridia bacterium]
MSDIQLNYVERGTGDALILLHGNGESLDYFAGQMDDFAKSWRVIALDTRGHGASPRGSAPFTIRQFAEDLRGFMDEKGIDSAHILGFSDGGNIALSFALKYPRRVKKLILNGANLDPLGVKLHVQIPVVLGYHIARLFAAKQPEARRKMELLSLMVNEPHFAPQDLKRLELPVLVIAGDRDMIRERHTRLIADSLPNARLAILKGNHFIANQNPEDFNRTVAEFLAE